MALTTLYDSALGILQGRIRPVNASPQDGSWVFALGADLPSASLPVEDVRVGDYIGVLQSVSLGGIKYIRITGRIRQPSDIPRQALLPASRLAVGGATSTTRPFFQVVDGPRTVSYWATATGTPATPITVEHVAPTADGPLLVTVAGTTNVTVRLGQAGGVLTSTQYDVARAVNADPTAGALVRARAAGLAGVLAATSGPQTLLVIPDLIPNVVTPTDFFTAAHAGRVLRVSGATNPGNNADYVLGSVLTPRLATLNRTVIAEDSAVTGWIGTLIGMRWQAQILVDGVVLATTTPSARHDAVEVDLAAHVSKAAAGLHDVAFRLAAIEMA